MFAGTPYAHDALGTRPSFDRPPGRTCCDSFTTPGTRPTTPSWSWSAMSIPMRLSRRSGSCSATSRQAAARAAPRASGPGARRASFRRYRPPHRHTDAGDARARAAQPGFSCTRSVDRCAGKRALRPLWPGTAGQGHRRHFCARPAAAGRSRLCSGVLLEATRIRRRSMSRCARSSPGWPVTACRRSWCRPRSSRSVGRQNSRKTRSRAWPRCGPMPWRSTVSTRPRKICNASRK